MMRPPCTAPHHTETKSESHCMESMDRAHSPSLNSTMLKWMISSAHAYLRPLACPGRAPVHMYRAICRSTICIRHTATKHPCMQSSLHLVEVPGVWAIVARPGKVGGQVKEVCQISKHQNVHIQNYQCIILLPAPQPQLDPIEAEALLQTVGKPQVLLQPAAAWSISGWSNLPQC